ncbi:hypothetical protein ACFWA5_25140 [Streptomyces mirabilis]|uniref:hypothetical protein n=1 Tax=Streptomyces mirabilis TaxID=68239 RepID=UPI003661D8AA
MPLDPYLLNPQQNKTINDAYSALISRCMRRFGYSYAATTESDDPSGMGADAPSTRIDGYFGFQSMAHAQKWGYHPEGGFPETKIVPDSNQTPNERAALTGSADARKKSGSGGQTVNNQRVPYRGCLGEANHAITGSATGYIGNPDFAVQLKFDTLIKGEKDPKTLAVFAKWSACMKASGYRYTDPLKAAGDPDWNRGRLPARREIEVAVADQECRRGNNVVGVWFSVDYEYQQQAVQENLAHLTAIKNSLTAHFAAAHRALGRPSRR